MRTSRACDTFLHTHLLTCSRDLRKVVSGLLLVLWTAAAVFLTFDSPFTSTGNGYFACWLGLACAVLWVYREFLEMQARCASTHAHAHARAAVGR